MLTLQPPLLTPVLIGLDPQPKQLFCIGDNLDNILKMPRLTVVGSRKPTAYGRAVTRSLTLEIARLGVAIVSGLAFGIDSIAHEATLEAGAPTIAIMPGGLDEVYPKTHKNLADRIVAQGGVLISEYPAHTPVQRHHFIERDRLMAAFGDAVLVTEAAQKSGTMHTAGFALSLGRPVLAVPGPITSPLSAGTNNLVKTGAVTVTDADDILQAMGLRRSSAAPIVDQTSTPEESAILQLLQAGISDGATLQLQSKLPAATFNQALTMLEITGRIQAAGGDQWSLI